MTSRSVTRRSSQTLFFFFRYYHANFYSCKLLWGSQMWLRVPAFLPSFSSNYVRLIEVDSIKVCVGGLKTQEKEKWVFSFMQMKRCDCQTRQRWVSCSFENEISVGRPVWDLLTSKSISSNYDCRFKQWSWRYLVSFFLRNRMKGSPISGQEAHSIHLISDQEEVRLGIISLDSRDTISKAKPVSDWGIMRHEAVLVPVESMNHSQEREREREMKKAFSQIPVNRGSHKNKRIQDTE